MYVCKCYATKMARQIYFIKTIHGKLSLKIKQRPVQFTFGTCA